MNRWLLFFQFHLHLIYSNSGLVEDCLAGGLFLPSDLHLEVFFPFMETGHDEEVLIRPDSDLIAIGVIVGESDGVLPESDLLLNEVEESADY